MRGPGTTPVRCTWLKTKVANVNLLIFIKCNVSFCLSYSTSNDAGMPNSSSLRWVSLLDGTQLCRYRN